MNPFSCLFGKRWNRSAKREPSTFIGENDDNDIRYASIPLDAEVVNLDNRQLGDAGVAYYLTAAVTPCRVLYLSRNHITRAGCQSLATTALTQPAAVLTVLCLNTNAIGAQGARTLAHALRFNTSVTELLIGTNQIGNAGARALAHVLESSNTTLRRLDLGNNRIGNAGAQAIASALDKNRTSLVKLMLWGNDIGPHGAQALARAMCTNTAVQELCLLNNRIGDFGAQSFARALEMNTTLEILILSNNTITDVSSEALAKALLGNSTLRKLDLQGNNLSPGGRDRIVQSTLFPVSNVVSYLMTELSNEYPLFPRILQAMNHNATLTELKLDFQAI